jgi:hypothetical protein
MAMNTKYDESPAQCKHIETEKIARRFPGIFWDYWRERR